MIYFSVAASRSTDKWSSAVDACKDTWKHTLLSGDELWFVFGNNALENVTENYMDEEGIFVEDEIYYPVPDSYLKILFKTVLNMRDFLKTQHQFYVRTHTGSYLHLGLMRDLCLRLPNTNLYGGFIGYNQESNTLFASGSCFVLSRDLVEKIVEQFPKCRDSVASMCDDVAIGNIVTRRLNAPILQLPRVDIFDKLVFDPSIAHYYFTKESGKNMDYYRIIHDYFTAAKH